jgi:hypothetical protein
MYSNTALRQQYYIICFIVMTIIFLYLFYNNILVKVNISDRYHENGFGEIGNLPSITL